MSLDAQFAIGLNSLAGLSPVLDSIVVFFASHLAYVLVLAFLAFIVFSAYTRGQKWEMLLVAGASALIARAVVTELIRYFYHRPRPFTDLPVHNLFVDTAWSFPSGHATFFFALSTAVYLYNKRWGTWFFVATVLMTVSRVIAGVHYPSDIVAGALIGIGIAYGTYSLTRFWAQKGAHKST